MSETQKLNLFDNCMVADLALRKAGNTRKADDSSVTCDADKQMLKLNKTLLPSRKGRGDLEEYAAITSFDGKFKNWIRKVAVPCPQFRAGLYLVPLDLFERIESEFAEFEAGRAPLIDRLMEERQESIQDAQVRLGSMYRENDYIPEDLYRASFSAKITYLSFNAPEQLKRINSDLYEREQAKIKAQWESATSAIFGALREDFRVFVQRLSDVLDRLNGKQNGGKRVQFKSSVIEGLQEFCETFKSRNITNDTELQALVDSVDSLIGRGATGLSPDELKASPRIRQEVKGKLDALLVGADKLVENAPKRKFRLS